MTTWSPERTRVVVLAAGRGVRLRPITDRIPKCLVPIAGRPLLSYWFDEFARVGLREVLINTHYLAEQVREHIARYNATGFRVVESFEPQLRGSAGTVAANRTWIDGADHCVLVYADNLSNVSLSALLDFHVSHGDPITMMLFRPADPRQCGVAELDSDGRIISFVEKPQQPRSDLANAGVYVLTAAAYREVADVNAFDFGFEVLPRFVGRMRGWGNDYYHRDIGTHEVLREAEELAPRLFRTREAAL